MRTLLVATLVLGLSGAAFAAEAPGKSRTEALIAALKKVKTDDGKLTARHKASNDKAFAELDGFFDYETLTARPIEPQAGKLKPEEVARFKTQFRELIRLVAYPQSGEFFQKAKLLYGEEKKVGEVLAVPMKLRVEADDLDLGLEFHWASTGGALKIVDVLFDGDSLVKDYQNQIAKVIAKSGVPGLFKALEDRRAELEKGK